MLDWGILKKFHDFVSLSRFTPQWRNVSGNHYIVVLYSLIVVFTHFQFHTSDPTQEMILYNYLIGKEQGREEVEH